MYKQTLRDFSELDLDMLPKFQGDIREDYKVTFCAGGKDYVHGEGWFLCIFYKDDGSEELYRLPWCISDMIELSRIWGYNEAIDNINRALKKKEI